MTAMDAPRRELIVVFGTVQRVMRAEAVAREAGLDVDVVPAPRAVSSECGVVLEAHSADAPRLEALLAEVSLAAQSVYRRSGEGWELCELGTASKPSAVRLTESSLYGGCGAKLAKGLLSNVLCGLPRLESDSLLVGIDTADDAGVVKVSDEVAIIHTTDFFPPMVDDPYTFGRVAAANALSDVYAMGGRPLAGLNLVSFPLERYDKEVLREILRGGLSALGEADGVLGGGHTLEGPDLLYGMAVTGVVHPDEVWTNEGAQAGDLLVLTKGLGAGLVTTAAKAGLAGDAELTQALRSMTTLNREAAEAAKTARPHAVTDITGFGLAGHGAELAEGSGLALELELAALPALPGALDAARQGCVPEAVAKNRESLGDLLEVDEGADPFRVDLALDPQTSGGLLVAVEPEKAPGLRRRLPGAAIVGRCVPGEAGQVRLAASSLALP